MPRIIDCPRGHQLRGADDRELFRLAREHIGVHHPEMQRTDDEVWRTIHERAREEVPATR